MTTRITTAALSAIAIAGTLTLNAQTANPPTQQPQTDQQRATAGTQAKGNAADRILTLSGCLQAEKDVPGRRESVAERAGMGEDYILTNVKMGQGAATAGIGLGSMYQIKGGSLKESELKNHLGHQVELTGSIEAYSDIRGGMAGRSSDSSSGTGGAATDRGARTGATTAQGNSNLPNFEATGIKMIAASCQTQ